MPSSDSIPYGFCHCGCGLRAGLAKSTRRDRGYVKGRPLKFYGYHFRRTEEQKARRRPTDSARTKPLAERFWAAVDRRGADECWPWRLSLIGGYGSFRVSNTRCERAHRVAWRLTSGPIPVGRVVCHRCDNPPCCNPAHLFIGTVADNVRDMDAKGRRVNADHVGDRNPMAKLTNAKAAEIKKRIDAGERLKDIARDYGVSANSVSSIKRGILWSFALAE